MSQEAEQPSANPRPAQDYEQMVDSFSDTFQTHINPWSASVLFGVRGTLSDEAIRYENRVRMPLQQAKALAVILLRSVRQYEEQSGADIDLPATVLAQLGIALEDWERFKTSNQSPSV